MKNKSAIICVHILHETEDGFKVCEDENDPEKYIWMPKQYMEPTEGGTVDDYGPGDTIECHVPMWVAIQKGLV